jgi:hypothetical protein
MSAIGSIGYPPPSLTSQTRPVAKPAGQDGFANNTGPAVNAATAQSAPPPQRPLYVTA